MQVHVTSEVGRLRAVLLGPAAGWRPHPPINETQRHFFQANPPRPARLEEQHQGFVDLLEQEGVEIHWVTRHPHARPQLFTRDVAAVLGDTLLRCTLKESIRGDEGRGLDALVARLDGPVEAGNAGIVEGGDLVIDGERLYVGMGSRSDAGGVAFLRERFGGRFEIEPLRLAPPFLHLDVVFSRVGRDGALIYPPAFEPEAVERIRARYWTIEVDWEEQFGMGANLFSLAPDRVIADARFTRLHRELRARGIEVLEIPYDEVAKLGGGLRCSTCPLLRDP